MKHIPTIVILVGITGDLAKRKLLPAIEQLKAKNLLPEQFELVGITRRNDPNLFTMDLNDQNDYIRLADHLNQIEAKFGQPAQRLFYLSVAPTVSLPIIEHLGNSGLSEIPNTKLLLEKPFGTDLHNAEEILIAIAPHFQESQIYRIDHYLAKDSVRALANYHLKTEGLETITVSASEKIGIEGRGDFYEQTGALRDFIQSHLLEVAAMTISPEFRLQALRDFYIPDYLELTDYVTRGQYAGYRASVGNPTSMVETKVSVTVKSRASELADVPVILKTGKSMDKKNTEITLTYQDKTTETIDLNDTTNAYESVFLDAIKGDKTFFISQEEVLETWRILEPIQDTWDHNLADLEIYPEGSTL